MDTKRFNTPQYKRQIRAVRSYKRMARPAPNSLIQKFLAIIGLGSIFRQIIFVLILAGLIYLVYFAPFLRIKTFAVQGADQQTQNEIIGYFNSYLSNSHTILPQKNILFFNGKNFSEYLLANEFKISAVKIVQRKFFHTVNISVVQRVPEYILQSGNNFYYLNSDGYLSLQLSAADPKYPLVVDTSGEALNPGQQIFNAQKFSTLQYLRDNFSKAIPLQFKNFEFPNLVSNSIYIDTQQGAQIRLDSTANQSKYLSELLALWNNLSSQQQNTLAYVDLRFDPKAYVCYKGSACAQPAVLPPTTVPPATSSVTATSSTATPAPVTNQSK